MERIYLLYFRFINSIKTIKGVYEIIFWAVMLIVFMLFSNIKTNHTVEVWASGFAGLTTGAILIKLPAIIVYFKENRKKAIY